MGVERLEAGTPEDLLLIVYELVCHKPVQDALTATRRAKRALEAVGTGRERPRTLAGSGAEFMGRISGTELAALSLACREQVERFASGVLAQETVAALEHA